MLYQAQFSFHGPLNDFLSDKSSRITYTFKGTPTVKDAIEAIGVPHPEVRGIFVNKNPVDFLYKIRPDDNVAVFAAGCEKYQTVNFFKGLPQDFIVDVHLGKLAKDLRMLGFNCLYSNDNSKENLMAKAEDENRIILSRDIKLLKNGRVKRGYWLRSQDPKEQLIEVVKYFQLIDKIQPFTRCIICNGKIEEVSKETIEEFLLPKTKQHFNKFYQCHDCSRIYWEGSHFDRMENNIQYIKKAALELN